MKKLLLAISMIAIVTFANGCKKTWTCECTYKSPFTGLTTTVSGDSEEKMTKSDAKDDCEVDGTNALKSMDPNASCKLK